MTSPSRRSGRVTSALGQGDEILECEPIRAHVPGPLTGGAATGLVTPALVRQRAGLGSMRKQYHLWPSSEGVDAWEVDRLIALTQGLPVEEIAIGSLDEIDSNYWFTPEVEPTVRRVVEHLRLIDAVDLSFPIILGPDGRVMDGMHRVARALRDGLETVRAVRLAVLPAPDFRNCRPQDLPCD